MLVLPRSSAPSLRAAAVRARSAGPAAGQPTGRAHPTSVKLTSDRAFASIAIGSAVVGSWNGRAHAFSSSSARLPSLVSSLLRPSTSPSVRHNSTQTQEGPPPSPSDLFADPEPVPSSSAPSTGPFAPPTQYMTYLQAMQALPSFRTLNPPATPEQYDQLITALAAPPRPNPGPLVETHAQMVDLAVNVSAITLGRLIAAFCKTDSTSTAPPRPKQISPQAKGLVGMSDKPDAAYETAVALFRAVVFPVGDRPAKTLQATVYDDLLAAAARNKDAQTAREVFLNLDAVSEAEPVDGESAPKVSYAALTSLIEAFATANGPAVRAAFDAARAKERSQKIAPVTSEAHRTSLRSTLWTAAMKGYLRCGDVESARELFIQVAAVASPAAAPSPTDTAKPDSVASEPDSVESVSPPSEESATESSAPTSIETVQEGVDPSPTPYMNVAKLVQNLFGDASLAKIRREHLSDFVAVVAPSVAAHSPAATARLVKAAIKLHDADGSSDGICAVLRVLEEHAPDDSTDVDYFGVKSLLRQQRQGPKEMAYAYKLIRARVAMARKIDHFVGSKFVLWLAQPSTRPQLSPDEIAKFHGLATRALSVNRERLNYHRWILSAVLKETTSWPARQLAIAIALTEGNSANRMGSGTIGLQARPDHVGAFKDIYTKAKAELGGDITRIGLTSSSVGILLDYMAATDEAQTAPTRTASRRPETSLVEAFVNDLIAVGESLGELNVDRRKSMRARKILAETLGKHEAGLLLAPFLAERVEGDQEDEASVDIDQAQTTESPVTVEAEAEVAEQGEVTKLSVPAFDFADAPWRSLVGEGQGLVALIPQPKADSPSAEAEPVSSETASSPSDPSDPSDPAPSATAPAQSSSPADNPSFLFFDPPTTEEPALPTSSEEDAPASTDSTPSPPKTKRKWATPPKPRRTSSERSAQLLSARLASILQTADPSTAVSSYHCLRDILTAGHIPQPWLVSRVAEMLGRRSEHAKVVEVVQLLEHIFNNPAPSSSPSSSDNVDGDADVKPATWSFATTRQVHSDVIAAFAYCGDTISTAYHKRYLETAMGVRPSSQAYGALIFNGVDATSDGSYAVKLWQEARQGNKMLHRHLFNGMMKAFGEAGKADEAVELLEQMRTTQGQATPSWASYGFAIEACLKSGKLDQAKTLYDRMQTETLSVVRRQFKPSILPFTSMMQHYALRAPDRDALIRIDADLRQLDLLPHSLTFEVLIHAYGAIAPVDKDTMWDVIELLEKNETIHAQVKGYHWAGVMKCLGADDFDAALATFDLIADRPSSRGKNPPLPDVACYDAILEIAQKHSRADVTDRIVQGMEATLMASTAKADLLIKTYGESGKIDKAREVFETTLDEPADLVNPRRTDPSAPIPHPTSTIYRSAKTYATLIRAEHAAGNSAEAIALLERMTGMEWKEGLRPVAMIRELGELLGVETQEDAEEVVFSFERDLDRNVTITLGEQNAAGEVAVEEDGEQVETEEGEVVVEGEPEVKEAEAAEEPVVVEEGKVEEKQV